MTSKQSPRKDYCMNDDLASDSHHCPEEESINWISIVVGERDGKDFCEVEFDLGSCDWIT